MCSVHGTYVGAITTLFIFSTVVYYCCMHALIVVFIRSRDHKRTQSVLIVRVRMRGITAICRFFAPLYVIRSTAADETTSGRAMAADLLLSLMLLVLAHTPIQGIYTHANSLQRSVVQQAVNNLARH